jgi:ATP-dependent DNA helicase RecQ
MPTPLSILKDTFGFDSFRPFQHEVIKNVLARHDTLAIMPTGGGKSLCYQIPALLFTGLTVVVSPLISLMKDQVEQLQALGVPGLFLNSSLSPEDYQRNIGAIRSGDVKLLYVAPETLLTPRLFSLLASLTIDCLTIDEAHCISEWGHDFRPEYRQIVEARRRFPKAVCLALTATATPQVRADIRATLGFNTSNEFVASFNRENLYIEVVPKRDPFIQTIHFLEQHEDQSGIIYCFSRRQVDDLTEGLVRRGYSVRPYHAGLEDSERRSNQEAFSRDDVQIIVATIAFGMGINKSNVRFILHYDLPKSIEGYYQEIGRAGRDGLPSHCLLLYSYGDVAKLRFFIEQKEGKERRVADEHLEAIVKYAEDETNCRRKPLLNYFGEPYSVANCGNCDNCNAEAPRLVDITIQAQKFLSCVKRTGERFGAAHVVEVLLGSRTEKVLKYKHDQLSTHGIGVELNKKQWMHLSRQLVQMGFLNQDGEYRVLSLTEKASSALRDRRKIMGQLQEVEERAPRKANQAELEYNHALFALLRAKRKELADAAGVPPYVIFSDRTLVEMAGFFPQSRDSLLQINGVGKVKLNQYGDQFLELIGSYCQKHKIEQKSPSGKNRKRRWERPSYNIDPAASKSDANRLYMLVGEAYNRGESIQELCDRFQVQPGTILDHLARYQLAGETLERTADLMSFSSLAPEDQAAVFLAFDELGPTLLKPIFDKLNGTVNYDELKILRICYLSGQAKKSSAQ